MQVGKLNRLVQLQQQVDDQDAIGQPVQAWATLATVWADVRLLAGVETVRGGAESSIAKASIRIRWRTDVTAAMRVLVGSTVYQVKAVLPDESGRRHVDLSCEVVA